ncbi:MAG: SRPBCC family protein [Candidatus Planktophila sp.]|nr:SRPBCC family protein [Candidatus Planktophila sp.]MBP7903018.1 SRPBCC family protein [Candidatus Planktophila sp.]
MSESSTSTVEVAAPLAEVAAKLSAIAGYPEWLSSIKKVEVTESDAEGRATKADVSIDAGVMKDRATLSYDWSQAPNEISFSLDDADLMTAMDGKYTLKAVDADTTLVTYELGVELSLPVPRMMISKTEKTTIDQALKELQAQFE